VKLQSYQTQHLYRINSTSWNMQSFLMSNTKCLSTEHHLILLKPGDKEYAHFYLHHSFLTKTCLICNMTSHKPGNLGSMYSRATELLWLQDVTSYQANEYGGFSCGSEAAGAQNWPFTSLSWAGVIPLICTHDIMFRHRGTFIYQCQRLGWECKLTVHILHCKDLRTTFCLVFH
jgi:hypothetical protein